MTIVDYDIFDDVVEIRPEGGLTAIWRYDVEFPQFVPVDFELRSITTWPSVTIASSANARRPQMTCGEVTGVLVH